MATCPIDKKRFPLAEVFDDGKERRRILNLKVRCMNRQVTPNDGRSIEKELACSTCSWTGELRALEVR
jgi:hypothetical protein